MRFLCLETSSSYSSAALSNGQDCCFKGLEAEHFQAEQILTVIDALFQETGLKSESLDALVVSIGPGSFTALRVGVAVAQGLALAWGKPIIALGSLNVLAQGVYRRHGCEQIAIALDARRNEIYFQKFSAAQGLMGFRQEAVLMKQDELKSLAKPWVGAGEAFLVYPQLQEKIDFCYLSETDRWPLAQDMVSLALQGWQQGLAQPANKISPQYLRNTVVLERQGD